jgi:DNA-directed RNA polymerase specialized sigma24 family protein
MMHRLPEDQVEAFEEHYFACNNCATILQRVAAYVDAMRAAAWKLWLVRCAKSDLVSACRTQTRRCPSRAEHLFH